MDAAQLSSSLVETAVELVSSSSPVHNPDDLFRAAAAAEAAAETLRAMAVAGVVHDDAKKAKTNPLGEREFGVGCN